MGSIVLLDLMGGVALLLWGLHMVLTGGIARFWSQPSLVSSQGTWQPF